MSRVLLAVVVVLVAFVLKTLKDAGTFKTLTPINLDQCQRIDGPPGFEDGQVHRGLGLLFTSSDTRFDWFEKGYGARLSTPDGKFWAFPTNGEDEQKLFELRTKGTKHRQHPHGLYVDEANNQLLSINHGETGDTVDIFAITVDPAVAGQLKQGKHVPAAQLAAAITLELKHSVSSPLFKGLNDVVAVGPTSFYTTIWQNYNDTDFMNKVEVYLQLPWHTVVQCTLIDDSWDCVEAAGGLKMANGIAKNAAGTQVYVAQCIARSINVYDRNPKTDILTFNREIFVETMIDNIDVDAHGDLYAGCHPQGFKFMAHAHNPTTTHAPSEVIRVQLKEVTHKQEDVVSRVFVDPTGDKLSASSYGAMLNDHSLAVGGVFDKGILVCRV